MPVFRFVFQPFGGDLAVEASLANDSPRVGAGGRLALEVDEYTADGI